MTFCWTAWQPYTLNPCKNPVGIIIFHDKYCSFLLGKTAGIIRNSVLLEGWFLSRIYGKLSYIFGLYMSSFYLLKDHFLKFWWKMFRIGGFEKLAFFEPCPIFKIQKKIFFSLILEAWDIELELVNSFAIILSENDTVTSDTYNRLKTV